MAEQVVSKKKLQEKNKEQHDHEIWCQFQETQPFRVMLSSTDLIDDLKQKIKSRVKELGSEDDRYIEIYENGEILSPHVKVGDLKNTVQSPLQVKRVGGFSSSQITNPETKQKFENALTTLFSLPRELLLTIQELEKKKQRLEEEFKEEEKAKRNQLEEIERVHIQKLEELKQKQIKELEERERKVKEREDHMEALQKKLDEGIQKAKTKLVFDVGGTKFAISKQAILESELNDTYFHGLLNADWKTEDDGSYFIDRSPTYFHIIIDFFRTGKIRTLGLNNDQIQELQQELDYYSISPPQPIESFSQCSASGITVSGNIATNSSGHHFAIGNTPINSGVAIWTIKIHSLHNNHWIMFGIVNEKQSDNNSYIWTTNYAWAKNNQKYFAGKNISGDNTDWVQGDTICLTLDITKSCLQVKNIRSGQSFQMDNIPSNRTWYVHVNLHGQSDKVEIESLKIQK
eukprot:c21666_g2_i1.p1 GENE.c21666_g2_i1~~c21666_g2_i1.p1  ORF type:complete len:467 (+),score=167.08 c21666_g2_i1:25-1401(+)